MGHPISLSKSCHRAPGNTTSPLSALYARFGVPEYWIVDPIVRSVTVLTLASEAYEALPLLAGGAIESRVLPDLKLTLEQIFEDIG
jgi:Uma2 family endonuclease